MFINFNDLKENFSVIKPLTKIEVDLSVRRKSSRAADPNTSTSYNLKKWAPVLSQPIADFSKIIYTKVSYWFDM